MAHNTKFLTVSGGLYLGVMLLRLLLGLTLFGDSRWFGNHIATFFHIVLASFLLVTGDFHLAGGRHRDASSEGPGR